MEQQQKQKFVEGSLQKLLKELNDSILRVGYLVTEYGTEYVEIVYENTYRKRVNVTADSLYAIAVDVLRSGGF